FLRDQLSTITLSAVVRTQLLRDIGGFCADHVTANDLLVLGQILLAGRSALLNEQCATLTIHSSSLSTRSGLDYGFRDLQRVMAKISELADKSITDEAERRSVQAAAARYVATKYYDFLVLYRRQGATLRDVAAQWRTWRAQASKGSTIDFASTLRLK